MTVPASTPFHLGLTPERIIDAAQQLTRESNLFGWSIRDLARRLQVTPSVIYHHVGGKDLLAKRVAERVIASIHAPDGALEWQEWFRRLLIDAVYPAAVSHPGVAKWLLMHGVPFPSAAGIFEVGIGKLERAGIEPGALIAYSAIMNNATLTISMGDERLLHEEDGPRDHAAMMAEFQRAYTDHPRMAALGDEFIAGFAEGGETAARLREQYYRYVVEVTLTGVASGAGPAARSAIVNGG
ncbi:TetR family transcriptional regulator [Leucobacter sp. UCD-THU]|nr:TetR family transcriptional regulator [Leucobacter sp. UCD-THU]